MLRVPEDNLPWDVGKVMDRCALWGEPMGVAATPRIDANGFSGTSSLAHREPTLE